jgi:hypothetical protein
VANKVLRIPKNDLPPVESDNVYSVRFRVVSEDKNRTSHWSPVFVIESTTPVAVSGEVVVSGPIVIAAWEDEENRPQYDVFVKFDSDPYIYHGTTPIHTYTFLNEASSTVRVKVQIVGSAKTSNATLTIWESAITSV